MAIICVSSSYKFASINCPLSVSSHNADALCQVFFPFNKHSQQHYVVEITVSFSNKRLGVR